MSLRTSLLPLTLLYRSGLALREYRLRSGREPVRKLKFPVVSIGNLSTGGAGKTPLAIAVAKLLMQRGLKVDVLSRGYGREDTKPARVNPVGTAREFGDEPLLIARGAGVPVYVARQRYEAGLLAERDSSSGAPLVHVLDDGFQHRQLAREVDILLINRADWRDHLLPAGNLREPLQAIQRASVLAIPAEDPALGDEIRAWGWRGPFWRVRRVMNVPRGTSPVLAFSGIARPQQFFAGLEQQGVKIAQRIDFPDHNPYTARDLQKIVRAAKASGAAVLLTTEKDKVRLEPLMGQIPADLPLETAGLRSEIEEEAAAMEWLLARLSDAKS